ncbi:hypothetical protein DOY81_011130 [Sarcophaga bullata]|nr:hypothetical protein DOY81_011130 [Sarcophaga bullata]
MLQRGLLTNAEQQPTPYDTTRSHRCGTTRAEANLHRDEEGQEFNNELLGQQQQQQQSASTTARQRNV